MPDDRPMASPVFVDPTGRRRRTIRTTAVFGACSLLAVSGLIVAALLGAPLGPLNPLPDPASGPPAAVEPVPGQQPATATGGHPPTSTKSNSRPGDNRGVGPAVTTTTPPGVPIPTTTSKGNKPTAPPGKPTDLPTPPGHTR